MPNYIVHIPYSVAILWIALIAESILFVAAEKVHQRQSEVEAGAYQSLINMLTDRLVAASRKQGAEDGK